MVEKPSVPRKKPGGAVCVGLIVGIVVYFSKVVIKIGGEC